MTEENNSQKEDKKFDEMFVHLVLGMQTTGYSALGKIINPMTGKQDIDLQLAKEIIDTLIMFKEKTKGNLNETEEGLLTHTLEQLQINYIELAKKQSIPKDSSTTSEDVKTSEEKKPETPEKSKIKGSK